jgi:hypothetical protein
MSCMLPLIVGLFLLLQFFAEQPQPFRLVGRDRLLVTEIKKIAQPFSAFSKSGRRHPLYSLGEYHTCQRRHSEFAARKFPFDLTHERKYISFA